jgi:hypothetical protein
MSASPEVYELAGGEFVLWADKASVMIKVMGSTRDPVELGEGELEELIEILQALAKRI